MTTRPSHIAIAAAVLILGFALMALRIRERDQAGLPLPPPPMDQTAQQVDAAIHQAAARAEQQKRHKASAHDRH